MGGGHFCQFDQIFRLNGLIAMFSAEHSKIRNLIKAQIRRMVKITLIRDYIKRRLIKKLLIGIKPQ